MSLQEKIDHDLKEALSAKDAARLSTVRFLKSALKYAAIEKKKDVLTDAEVQQIIQKQIKQHRESIEQFAKAGRKELAEKEKIEADILENYLPKQLSDAELEQFIQNETKAAGASTKKDFGRMMKLLSEKLSGKADAGRMSAILGRILQ